VAKETLPWKGLRVTVHIHVRDRSYRITVDPPLGTGSALPSTSLSLPSRNTILSNDASEFEFDMFNFEETVFSLLHLRRSEYAFVLHIVSSAYL
jgi:hypothetical protein